MMTTKRRFYFLLLIPLLLTGCETDFQSSTNRALIADIYVDQGKLFQASGHLQEAFTRFSRALDQDPYNYNAHFGIGEIYEERGNYDEAAKKYNTARTVNPRSFVAHYKYGLMNHLLDRVKIAVAAYLDSLAVEPDDFKANLNLATAYLQLNQPKLALPYGKKAVDLDPDIQAAHVNLGSIYFALEEYDEAVLSYRAAADHGDLTSPIALNLVRALLKSDKPVRAINTLEAMVRREARADYYERLGYAYYKIKKNDKSIRAYQKAIELDPKNAPALNGLGVNLMAQYLSSDRVDQEPRNRAINAWRESIKINRDQPRILDLISRYHDS